MKPGKKELGVIKNKDKDALLQEIINSCIEYAGESYEDFAKEVIDSLRKYKLVDYGKAPLTAYEHELKTALRKFGGENYIVREAPWEIINENCFNNDIEIRYREDTIATIIDGDIKFYYSDEETKAMISKNVQEIIFGIYDGISYNAENIATLNQYLKKTEQFDKLEVSVWKDELSKNLGDDNSYSVTSLCDVKKINTLNLSQLIEYVKEFFPKENPIQISLEIGDDICEIYNRTPEKEYLCNDLFERYALPVNNESAVATNEQDEIDLD